MSSNKTDKPLKYVTDTQLDINMAMSVLITSVTIPSNFILILIFLKFKKLRDLNNTAITILSATDFLRGCIVMTMKIHNQITRVEDLHWFTCHLTALICAFSFVFSPLMLAFISFVRYCKIVPHSSKRWNLTDRNFYIITAVLFFVACLFSILPYLGVGEYKYSQSHGVCFADWRPINKVFRTIFYILVIGIAFPVLTISYTTLYIAIHKHNKKMTKQMYRANTSDDKSSSISHFDTVDRSVNSVISSNDRLKEGMVAIIVENEISPNVSPTISTLRPSSNQVERKEKKERKTSKTTLSRQEYRVTQLLILIFIAYIVCWFPAALVNVIALTHWHTIPEIWFYIIVTLVELKSALDPVIYGLGNKKYRKGFSRGMRQLKGFINNNIISHIRWFTNV